MELDLTPVSGDLSPDLFLLAPTGVEAASSPPASLPTTAVVEAEGPTMSLHRLLASSGIEAGTSMNQHGLPESAVKEVTRNPVDLQGLRASANVEASEAPVHLRELLAVAGVERSGAPVNLNMLLASVGTDTAGAPINLEGSVASSGVEATGSLVYPMDKYQRTTLAACHSDHSASSAVKVGPQVEYFFRWHRWRHITAYKITPFSLKLHK
jgi:hypothetical protein